MLDIHWSEEDEAYIAVFPDEPSLSGFSATPHGAARELLIAYHLAYQTQTARIEAKEAEIVALSRALIDLENWVVAAERAGVTFPRPASFGQWRRS